MLIKTQYWIAKTKNSFYHVLCRACHDCHLCHLLFSRADESNSRWTLLNLIDFFSLDHFYLTTLTGSGNFSSCTFNLVADTLTTIGILCMAFTAGYSGFGT